MLGDSTPLLTPGAPAFPEHVDGHPFLGEALRFLGYRHGTPKPKRGEPMLEPGMIVVCSSTENGGVHARRAFRGRVAQFWIEPGDFERIPVQGVPAGAGG